jgi:hypothetical protein
MYQCKGRLPGYCEEHRQNISPKRNLVARKDRCMCKDAQDQPPVARASPPADSARSSPSYNIHVFGKRAECFARSRAKSAA